MKKGEEYILDLEKKKTSIQALVTLTSARMTTCNRGANLHYKKLILLLRLFEKRFVNM
jgi:hypothetical protein